MLELISPPYIEKTPDLAVVGGVTRAGKDTTMRTYRAAAAYLTGETVIVPLDGIKANLLARPDLQAIAYDTESGLERDLFQQVIDNGEALNDEEWVSTVLHRTNPDGTSYFHTRHDRQNRAVWQLGGMPDRINKTMQQPGVGRLFIQGVAMLPEHAARLRETYPHLRALYLINTNPDHVKTILDSVHYAQQTDPSSNWMSSWSDARIIEYMKMNLGLSQQRREEAEAYGFPWCDMGYGDFRENIACNVGYLLHGHLPEGGNSITRNYLRFAAPL